MFERRLTKLDERDGLTGRGRRRPAIMAAVAMPLQPPRSTGPRPHRAEADQRMDRPSGPGLGRRPDRRADQARQHGVPDPARPGRGGLGPGDLPAPVLDATDPPPAEGARVLIWAKPDFNTNRGSFSLSAMEIRAVGIGELLARLERLRRSLAAEGLFAAERKRPLPFLPGKIGLICGRDSAAEKDVLRNSAPIGGPPSSSGSSRSRSRALRGRRDRRRAAPAGRRPVGGRDRHRPGRRLDRGPAAVLRRNADPGRGGGEVPGGERDRP